LHRANVARSIPCGVEQGEVLKANSPAALQVRRPSDEG
jgi:hypothetical protein